MTPNKDVLHKLTRARTALLIDQPFFGTLLLRLKLIEENKIPTLAVDGKSIYYNPKFVDSLSADLIKSALVHEIGHCIFDHIGRRDSRNPGKWNYAGDYVINEMLKNSGFQIGPGWLLEPAFFGMTADHIYALLPDTDKNGNKIDYNQGALCEIIDSDSAEGAAGGGEAERKMLAAEWQIATLQAASSAKAQGQMPGALERFITDVASPKVDWKQQLRNLMTDVRYEDYNWSRANRRFVPYGFMLPSLYSEGMGHVVVVSDDSGSIDQATLDAMSAEINAIRDSTMPDRTTHISCDARINHTQDFEMGQPFKMVSRGGGGTDFRPPFNWVEEQGLQPKVLVYLTDGYGPFPPSPPDYRVIWCMITDVQPPWGEIVRIEI